jgi:hypothetical protein
MKSLRIMITQITATRSHEKVCFTLYFYIVNKLNSFSCCRSAKNHVQDYSTSCRYCMITLLRIKHTWVHCFTFLVDYSSIFCLWFFFLKKNILNPNVAEKNILILVEEKKKSDSEFLSYNLMLNSGKK